MDIGMLWYDTTQTLVERREGALAVDFYKTKYGTLPTVCFITATFKDRPHLGGRGVQLRSARTCW